MRNKLELSLAVGIAAMLLCCGFAMRPMQWWGVAFSSLCDGVLSARGQGEIVLRSGLWELISGWIA